MKMNRRDFLKIVGSALVLAAIGSVSYSNLFGKREDFDNILICSSAEPKLSDIGYVYVCYKYENGWKLAILKHDTIIGTKIQDVVPLPDSPFALRADLEKYNKCLNIGYDVRVSYMIKNPREFRGLDYIETGAGPVIHIVRSENFEKIPLNANDPRLPEYERKVIELFKKYLHDKPSLEDFLCTS